MFTFKNRFDKQTIARGSQYEAPRLEELESQKE